MKEFDRMKDTIRNTDICADNMEAIKKMLKNIEGLINWYLFFVNWLKTHLETENSSNFLFESWLTKKKLWKIFF